MDFGTFFNGFPLPGQSAHNASPAESHKPLSRSSALAFQLAGECVLSSLGAFRSLPVQVQVYIFRKAPARQASWRSLI